MGRVRTYGNITESGWGGLRTLSKALTCCTQARGVRLSLHVERATKMAHGSQALVAACDDHNGSLVLGAGVKRMWHAWTKLWFGVDGSWGLCWREPGHTLVPAMSPRLLWW